MNEERKSHMSKGVCGEEEGSCSFCAPCPTAPRLGCLQALTCRMLLGLTRIHSAQSGTNQLCDSSLLLNSKTSPGQHLPWVPPSYKWPLLAWAHDSFSGLDCWAAYLCCKVVAFLSCCFHLHTLGDGHSQLFTTFRRDIQPYCLLDSSGERQGG